jgi:hypothetical protein
MASVAEERGRQLAAAAVAVELGRYESHWVPGALERVCGRLWRGPDRPFSQC